MEQRISLVTLGVADVARARAFYERLGWRGQEVEDTVFFQAGCLAVVLWGREKLAADSGVPGSAPGTAPGTAGTPTGGDAAEQRPPAFGGIVLAHNVRSAREVDEVLAAAERAGATVTRAAATTFYGGYAGTFADPDGHLWEVAHNPGFTLEEDGSLVLPDFGTGG
ncbi:VOC family protein [Streptomyces sp. JJ36]|uniref:VOC family protein n=1 Tax=Streptomyces sp. JJ36 TaxID=2736645 RepID=UPI001F39D804|nr:VOC family protein [Streptomyces sp. JJ36]MCF6523683.1 VOC family protein [Streptomyces sp. JJ36]